VTGGYQSTIGLEVHVQLATRTKMFCGDLAEFEAPPNTLVCPVCLGHPGALPVVNGAAVELAIRVAVALECRVHPTSVFARKNYFYPDLPKGYQITQYERPLATGGRLTVVGSPESAARPPADPLPSSGPDTVRIRRIHLEEDSGRSLHDRLDGRTAVDLNRAGVPLIEIVTEPDLRGPAHARAFLTRLKQILEYLEVSDCDMEKGSLRVDANLSVRPAGSDTPGTKTEVKNLNSFANVERALGHEAERQERLLRAGRPVVHETLLWDAAREEVRPMRAKEETRDYRYFREPDLPPLVVAPETIGAIRDALPELPHRRESRFRAEYGLPDYDAAVLTASRDVADYYEDVAREADDAKIAGNWVMTEVMAWRNETGAGAGVFPMTAVRLAELIDLVQQETLSTSAARTVFSRMVETGRSAPDIVEAEGLTQVRDEGRLEGWVAEAMADHPDEAKRLRAGEERLVGYFMGQVMRRSKGRADPRRTEDLIRRRIGR
jgi:aspartyl-tRNA(Asn)/glutamyl-tRNA(Gln) amidotransferase subunit B